MFSIPYPLPLSTPPTPFLSPIPYPLPLSTPPTPFDACYAGYDQATSIFLKVAGFCVA